MNVVILMNFYQINLQVVSENQDVQEIKMTFLPLSVVYHSFKSKKPFYSVLISYHKKVLKQCNSKCKTGI